jgi:hypothetical protein
VVTPNTNASEHLEDSVLLAYLRQQLDDRLSLRISQHIDIEQCPRCSHRLNELSKVSTVLAVLGQMQAYQHYPEISVADTLEHVKSATNKRTTLQAYLSQINNRHRPRKTAVRWVSLPVAFALAILFTVAMLVFADLSVRPWISGLTQGRTNTSQNYTTSYPPHHATPAPNLTLTSTARSEASATPVPTATATTVTEPYLVVCSTRDKIAHWHLVICGYNFEAGTSVVLVAFPGKIHLSPSNALVDKRGNFQVEWYIGNCGNLPATISVYTKIDKSTFVVKLQNISFGSCPPVTPTQGPRNGPGV